MDANIFNEIMKYQELVDLYSMLFINSTIGEIAQGIIKDLISNNDILVKKGHENTYIFVKDDNHTRFEILRKIGPLMKHGIIVKWHNSHYKACIYTVKKYGIEVRKELLMKKHKNNKVIIYKSNYNIQRKRMTTNKFLRDHTENISISPYKYMYLSNESTCVPFESIDIQHDHVTLDNTKKIMYDTIWHCYNMKVAYDFENATRYGSDLLRMDTLFEIN